MKVIGAGFGRTGTSSLKAALQDLGFGPCLHMDDVVASSTLGIEWSQLFVGESVDTRSKLAELLGDYQSAVDWPVCCFWPELIHMHPDARVVLTVRDPDKWVSSFLQTLAPLWRTAIEKAQTPGDPESPHGAYYTLANALAQSEFTGRVFDPALLKNRYLQHVEQVKAALPAERLLVYSVSEGWPALCEFLNVDVPSFQFPHFNDRATFNAKAQAVFSQ
ncbi:sulfotransferase family protein [Mycobacterium haemophilum]